MSKQWRVAIAFAVLANPVAVYAQAERSPSRAELLYTTHCIACHDTEIHWRDKKIAKDWTGLRAQVSRWQAIAGLGWRDDDITGVARYLNTLHYHYPEQIRKSRSATNSTHALGSPGKAPLIQDQHRP